MSSESLREEKFEVWNGVQVTARLCHTNMIGGTPAAKVAAHASSQQFVE